KLEVQAVENLLAEAGKDAEFSKNKVLVAALEIGGGDALLGATTNPQTDKALKHYSAALRAAQEASQSAAKDLVLGQLAVSIAQRVGNKQKGGNDPQRIASDDGHRLIRESVSRIGDPEFPVDAWQQVCRALVKDGQSQRAATLAKQIFSGLSPSQEGRNRERMNMPLEGLGVAGLAMMREGKQKSDQEALGLAKQLAQEVVKKVDQKSVVPETGVALAVATGEAYPGPWNEAKHDAELWGLAWGKALLGNPTDANAIAGRSDGDQVDKFRARVAVTLGQEPPAKDPKEIIDLAVQTAASRPPLAGSLLRLARLGEEAGWPAASVAALAQPLASAPAGSAEA
ncbi:MAG: hypothetical protein ACKOS8_01410, partial [Gemmataceae bacterium]